MIPDFRILHFGSGSDSAHIHLLCYCTFTMSSYVVQLSYLLDYAGPDSAPGLVHLFSLS